MDHTIVHFEIPADDLDREAFAGRSAKMPGPIEYSTDRPGDRVRLGDRPPGCPARLRVLRMPIRTTPKADRRPRRPEDGPGCPRGPGRQRRDAMLDEDEPRPVADQLAGFYLRQLRGGTEDIDASGTPAESSEMSRLVEAGGTTDT